MFENSFLCNKSVKEMEKRTVIGEKTGFGVEKNGLQAVFLFQILSGCLRQ